MNRNASWHLNQTASYPLYKQPNSVRRCNIPLAMASLAIHMLQGGALRRTIFQTRQLPSDDTIWRPCQCGCNRRNKNCHVKICPWILPRTIAILSASADRPKSCASNFRLRYLYTDLYKMDRKRFVSGVWERLEHWVFTHWSPKRLLKHFECFNRFVIHGEDQKNRGVCGREGNKPLNRLRSVCKF